MTTTGAPNMSITPYLFFGGRCEEALEFYRAALDARVDVLMFFKESPEPMPAGSLPPGFENKIMHCSFVIRGTTLMASDGCGDAPAFSGFSLSLSMPDEAEAHRIFAQLSEGGEIRMPLTKTFWSPCFGMLTDRFGLGWMVIVPAEMG